MKCSRCSRMVGTEGRRNCEICLSRQRNYDRANAVARLARVKAHRVAGHCMGCGVRCENSRCESCQEAKNVQRRRGKPRAYVRGLPTTGPRCSRCVRATEAPFKMCIRCREDRAKRAAQWRAKASGSEALMQDHHARSKR